MLDAPGGVHFNSYFLLCEYRFLIQDMHYFRLVDIDVQLT